MSRIDVNSPEVKTIDDGVKNRFKWSWLQETLQVEGCTLSLDCFSKIHEPGKAVCNICNQPINYGANGKTALRKHMEHPKHINKWRIQQQNMHIEITPTDNAIVAAAHSECPRSIPTLCDRVAQNQVSFFCLFNNLFQ